jgi:hypothetical protein
VNELYSALFSWAVTLSGYPAPATMPVIEYVPHARLEQMMCKSQHCDVLGVYPPGETIYLDDKLDPQDNTVAASIVVHEMVHYLQSKSGRYDGKSDCHTVMQLEREAYSVQSKYLTAYGVYYPVAVFSPGCGPVQ